MMNLVAHFHLLMFCLYQETCWILCSSHGQQDSASTRASPPIPPAGQLLPPPELHWPPAASRSFSQHLQLQCLTRHPSPSVDPRLPAFESAPLHHFQAASSVFLHGLHPHIPPPLATQAGCRRAAAELQEQAPLWLCQPGGSSHPGRPPEGRGPEHDGCRCSSTGVTSPRDLSRPWMPPGCDQTLLTGTQVQPRPTALQDQERICLQVLRPPFHQVLQSFDPREDAHRRETIYLWYLPQGLQKTGPPSGPQVRTRIITSNKLQNRTLFLLHYFLKLSIRQACSLCDGISSVC